MILRTETLREESSQKPISGADVYVYNQDGTLADLTSDGVTPLTQPVTTDEFGTYFYYADTSYVTEDIFYGTRRIFKQANVAIGSPGADLLLRADLNASGGGALVQWIAAGTGAVARTVRDKLRELLAFKDYGAIGNGAADDTTPATNALTAARKIDVGIGTFILTSLTIPASTVVTTEGVNSIIKQKPATGPNTRIIKLNSDTKIETLKVQGQLNQGANDTTGEQNPAAFIYLESTDTASKSKIVLGDITGQDIRGDIVTTGVHPTAYTAGYRLSGMRMGRISGDNIYRNVVSLTGGNGYVIHSIIGTHVGYMHFDIEPDVGSGPVEDVWVGRIQGRFVGLVGPTAADYVDRVFIESMLLDAALTTGSTPAYTVGLTHALQIRNLKYAHIGKARVTGFAGAGVKQIYNGGELAKQTLHFGELDVSNNCTADAVNYGYVTGASGVTRVLIDSLRGTISDPKAALLTCDFCHVRSADVSNASSAGLLRSCANALVMNLNHAGAGGVFIATDNLVAINGKVAATASVLCSFSAKPLFIGYDVTATTLFNTCTNARLLHSTINGVFYYDYADGVYSIDGNGALTTAGAIQANGLTSTAARIGYVTGAGGAVTQLTSKSTAAPALNKACGEVTMNNAALAAATIVSFTMADSLAGAGDNVIVNHVSGGTIGAYSVEAVSSAGTITFYVRNNTAGSLSEALVLRFALIRAANS